MIQTIRLFASTACSAKGSFFGLPKWYAYLPLTKNCSPQFNSLSDTWLVVAAIIEMLLRIAAIGAVFMVIYGGVSYTTSMGNPEETNKARSTIIYSLVGLLITISAALIVTFIANSIGA